MLVRESDVIYCIDRVLGRLGANAQRTIVLHMRRTGGVKRQEIPQKPSEFIAALRSVLGRASIAIEREILEALEIELELKSEKNQDLLGLLSAINERSVQQVKDGRVEATDAEKYYTYMDYTQSRDKGFSRSH